MDPQQYQPAPVSTPSTPNPLPNTPAEVNVLNTNNHKKIGPIVASLIVILLLVIGALYVLASRVNKQVPSIDNTSGTVLETANTDLSSSQTAPIEIQPITGTSDDMNSLQADLNASLKGIDAQSI